MVLSPAESPILATGCPPIKTLPDPLETNDISGVHPDKGRDQTSAKQSTSNTCIKSANKCQGAAPFLRNGPVLPRPLGKT